MEKYYHVSMAVAPKRARLQEAQDRLQATLKALEAAKAKLYAVEENIRELEAKYADSVAKKSDLAAKVKDRLPALLYGKLIVCVTGVRVRTEAGARSETDWWPQR